MVEQIITAIIVLSSFLIGYSIGKNERLAIPEIKEAIRKKIIQSKIKPGPLMRPSVKQIDRRDNKKLYEGIDEVKRAFDELGVKNG